MKPTIALLLLFFCLACFISFSFQDTVIDADDSINGERYSFQLGCERKIRDLNQKIQQYNQVIEICDVLFEESQDSEILKWKQEAVTRLSKLETLLQVEKSKSGSS